MILENVRKIPRSDSNQIRKPEPHLAFSEGSHRPYGRNPVVTKRSKRNSCCTLGSQFHQLGNHIFCVGKDRCDLSVLINPNSQLHEMKTLLTYVDIEYLIIGDATKCVDPVLICNVSERRQQF
jgi:hypothetical protein